MSSIKGAAEIVINVRDIPGMQKFYKDALGFTFHSQFPDSEPTIVFLTVLCAPPRPSAVRSIRRSP